MSTTELWVGPLTDACVPNHCRLAGTVVPRAVTYMEWAVLLLGHLRFCSSLWITWPLAQWQEILMKLSCSCPLRFSAFSCPCGTLRMFQGPDRPWSHIPICHYSKTVCSSKTMKKMPLLLRTVPGVLREPPAIFCHLKLMTSRRTKEMFRASLS